MCCDMSDPTTAQSVPPPPTQASAPPVNRTPEVLCHVLSVAGFVFPFGNIIAPLILWLVKRSESASIDQHGKESVNFQISMTIWMILSGLSILVIIGVFLLPVVVITNIILVIVAAIKASNGEFYRYPLTIRFIK